MEPGVDAASSAPAAETPEPAPEPVPEPAPAAAVPEPEPQSEPEEPFEGPDLRDKIAELFRSDPEPSQVAEAPETTEVAETIQPAAPESPAPDPAPASEPAEPVAVVPAEPSEADSGLDLAEKIAEFFRADPEPPAAVETPAEVAAEPVIETAAEPVAEPVAEATVEPTPTTEVAAAQPVEPAPPAEAAVEPAPVAEAAEPAAAASLAEPAPAGAEEPGLFARIGNLFGSAPQDAAPPEADPLNDAAAETGADTVEAVAEPPSVRPIAEAPVAEAPAPEPVAETPVEPAPTAAPEQAAAPTPPAEAAPSGKPQRESLWAPSAPETAPEAPVIRVDRVAKPVAVPPPAPAAEAQSAPAAAEAAAPTGTQTQTNSSASGWPDQVTSLFSLSESESAVAAEPKAQAETQAQAQAEIPAQAQEPAPVVQSGVRRIGAPPPTPAPVETAAAPDPAPVPTTVNPAQPPPSMVSAAPLKGVSFRIGENHALGTAIPKDGPRRSLCVDKSHWSTMFCIEPVIWPAAMADHFQVTNNFYRGRQSIVQYQGGKAVQIHVLFPKDRLRAVTEHFKAVYGPPTDQPEILTALIGEPKRINRTVQWRSRDAKGAETVLEIREIDDLRWSAPPDTNHGVVRLYGADQGSVFELLSATDLLLVNIRRGS